jgi:O-antigen/teichoic acid export membrane protein
MREDHQVTEQGRRGVIIGLSGYTVARLVPGLLTVIGTPMMLLLYGASAYGEYSRTWAAGLIVASVTTGWLSQAILRDAGTAKWPKLKLPWWVIGAQLLFTAGPIAGLTVLTSRHPDATFMIAAASYCVSLVWQAKASALLQRDVDIRAIMLGEIVRAGATSMGPLLVVPMWRGSSALLLCALGGNLLYLVIADRFRSRRPGIAQHGAGPAPGWLSRYWRYGWPMSIWLALSSIVLYADRFVVTFFVDDITAGNYSAVSDLVVRGFGMIAMPITYLSHPEIMRIANTRTVDEVRRAISRWSRILWIWLGIALAIFVPLSPWLIRAILPTGRLSPLVAVFLGVMAALWQAALMAHKPQESARQTGIMLGAIAISVVCSVTFVVLGSYFWGAIGASVGALFGPVVYIAAIWSRRARAFEAVQEGVRL